MEAGETPYPDFSPRRCAVLCVNNHGVFTGKVLAQLNGGIRFLGLKYSGRFLRFLHRIINGCRCCGLFTALFRLVLEAPGSQEPYKNDQHQTEGKKLLQLPLTPGSLFLTSCFRTLGPTGRLVLPQKVWGYSLPWRRSCFRVIYQLDLQSTNIAINSKNGNRFHYKFEFL